MDKRDIANSLNEYFTTIASSLLASQQSHGYPVERQQAGPLTVPSHNFIFRAVSENDVFKALRTMDLSKATGADTIPAKVIRTAAPYISNVVAKLFNTFIRCGRFPSIWKTARVTPSFKGGPRPNVIIIDQFPFFLVSQKYMNRLPTLIFKVLQQTLASSVTINLHMPGIRPPQLPLSQPLSYGNLPSTGAKKLSVLSRT